MTFTIHADATQCAMRAVLTQEDEDGEHPIVYVSTVLTPAERSYSITDRDMLLILFKIQKMLCYEEGYYFKIKTDHIALKMQSQGL